MEAKQVLSDLETLHKIHTVDDYIVTLKAAIGIAENLNISTKELYYTYAPVIDIFNTVSFDALTFFNRISDSEYLGLLISSYYKLTGGSFDRDELNTDLHII